MSDRLQYFPVSVSQKKQETEQTVTLLLNIPGKQQGAFQVTAGKHINLSVEIEGQVFRRSYSLSNREGDDKASITIKRVENGIVSNHLNDHARPGFSLNISAPKGHFIRQQEHREKDAIFYAAGSGITPVYPLIESILRKEKHSKCTLFYGNRNEDQIIHKTVLDELQKEFSTRFYLVHILSQPSTTWKGKTGRIDRIKAADLYDYEAQADKDTIFYLCGPAAMMHEVKKALENRAVNTERILSEYFAAPRSNNEDIAEEAVGESAVTLSLYGQTHEFVAPQNKTILDTCIDLGIDIPYSCFSGVCSSCKADKISGEVKHDQIMGLTPYDQEKGRILCCQAYPSSETLSISFK